MKKKSSPYGLLFFHFKALSFLSQYVLEMFGHVLQITWLVCIPTIIALIAYAILHLYNSEVHPKSADEG